MEAAYATLSVPPLVKATQSNVVRSVETEPDAGVALPHVSRSALEGSTAKELMGQAGGACDESGCVDPGVIYGPDGTGLAGGYTQAPLPYVRGVLQPRCDGIDAGFFADFAHPFERAFAELLTFYGVRWSYEPTSFALTWSEDGSPGEMFTPDFYLPDQRLYIELTAMRQRLVTRKHRKLRQMRKLYPHVEVKLLYRRDYQRLASAYRSQRSAVPPPSTLLRNEAEIRDRISALAAALAVDLDHGERPLALAVGAGGAAFMAAIGDALRERDARLVLDQDCLEVARHRAGSAGRRVRVVRHPRTSVANRRVVVFVDIVSTGLTLAYLTAWLRRCGAASVEVCALLSRESARVVEVPVKYVGFLAPNEFVVGFGLNLFRQFRGLGHIAALSPQADDVTPDDDPGPSLGPIHPWIP